MLILTDMAKYRTTKGYGSRGIVDLAGVRHTSHMGGMPCLEILEALLWIYLIISSLIYLSFIIGIPGKGTARTKKPATESNCNMPPGGNIHNLPLEPEPRFTLEYLPKPIRGPRPLAERIWSPE